ncbi:MAG: hypothetical protein ACYC3X_00810 [Pirellulaceae bacterium]
MDKLRLQVRRAYRRLFWLRVLRSLTWTLLATLGIALVAVVIPKFWPLGVAGHTWLAGWLGGAVLAGCGLGCLWAYLSRQDELDAAIEIDLRYGLKERVASALTLSPEDQQTEVGRALVDDASRRVERIDVRERFRLERTWHPLLPLAVAALTFLIATLFQDATSDQAAATTASATEVNQQVRKSMQELKKRLAEHKKNEAANGLKEADPLMNKFEKAVESLEKNDVDRKQALVKLNNLSKEFAAEREKLGSGEKTREQLKQLKDIPSGPADRIASALQNGNMQQAVEELRKLGDKLRSADLSAAEKAQLKNQLQQLGKEIEKLQGARQELADKQRELREKIDELKKKGDLAGAGSLQQKLDQLQQQMDALESQNPQLQRLEELANKLASSAQSLQAGDGQKAARQLDQLAQDLQKLQEQTENLRSLDELMTEISDAKNAMHCKNCGGEGCEACQGAPADKMENSIGGAFSDRPGRGMGEGYGRGERPETETATGGYRTRVGAEVRPGESTRVGDANGPNLAGNSLESIKKEIASSFSEDPDPLVQQTLPRHEREQTREYFELLRKGR